MKIFYSTFLICVLAFAALAQGAAGGFEFRGVARDPRGAVFAGTTLIFDGGANGAKVSATTEIDGRFRVRLAPGRYEVTASAALGARFRAFIEIRASGLNPNDVAFVIAPDAAAEKDYPQLKALPKPPYPAAARAVRATGEVPVEVEIDAAGKVTAARVAGGHPLLRKAAETAARAAVFEPGAGARRALLTYVFLAPAAAEAPTAPARFASAYRVEVIGNLEIIQPSVDRAAR